MANHQQEIAKLLHAYANDRKRLPELSAAVRVSSTHDLAQGVRQYVLFALGAERNVLQIEIEAAKADHLPPGEHHA